MSKNLTPLTDQDIEAERRSDKHRRSKKIDDAFTSIIIACMWILFAIVIMAGSWFAYLYCLSLSNPGGVSAESVTKIETIARYAIVGIGGYVAHIAKRNIMK